MDRAKEIGRWLHERGWLRYLPLSFLKHYVYPLTVRAEKRPYDAKRFFDSWYDATPRPEFSDRIRLTVRLARLMPRLTNAVTDRIVRRALSAQCSH
jgi:hypothetical protein